MLNVNPEIVCRIIDLAREFHTQDAVSFPEPPEGPGTDWAVQLLSSHEEDLTYQAFEALVDDLEPDQQQEIVALLWLGREDFALDEWEVALEQAEYLWNENGNTAKYLMAHPFLADHLGEGLALHGYECE